MDTVVGEDDLIYDAERMTDLAQEPPKLREEHLKAIAKEITELCRDGYFSLEAASADPKSTVHTQSAQ